jgi:sirohydrochlorin cobaltochelatase
VVKALDLDLDDFGTHESKGQNSMSYLSRITTWLLQVFLTGCVAGQKEASMDQKPPAIVLIAFGTTSDKGREVFDVILQAARERYPNHDIRLAFTSRIVVERLRQRGIEVANLQETLADLQAQGHRRAVLQSLMIVPGQKNAEIAAVPTGDLLVTYGRPLLAGPEDVDAVVAAVAADVTADRPTVFVTHGNGHYVQYNRALLDFAEAVERRFAGAVTCSVEGQPGLAKLDLAREQSKQAGAVHFVPMMLVAGDHIENDVLGDEPHSWKNLVGAPEASCAKPLGYNPAILEIFFRHLDNAMANLQAEE